MTGRPAQIAANKRNREKYLSAGLCPRCRTHKLAEGYKLCLECLDKERERHSKEKKSYGW